MGVSNYLYPGPCKGFIGMFWVQIQGLGFGFKGRVTYSTLPQLKPLHPRPGIMLSHPRDLKNPAHESRKPQSPKTQKPQNPKAPKPQSPKTLKPQGPKPQNPEALKPENPKLPSPKGVSPKPPRSKNPKPINPKKKINATPGNLMD